MKILLTNDDGYDAPGIAALEQALRGFGTLIVIAPEEPQSGCSHRTTTSRPLTLRSIGDQRYALDGTPADCVRIGLLQVARDSDWVVSGINEGGNLGADVYLSGTVAAAREAGFLGVRAMALSQYRRGPEVDWTASAKLARSVWTQLSARPLRPPAFWNINLPDMTADPDIDESPTLCHVEPRPLPIRFEQENGQYYYRGNYHARPRSGGSDVDVCFGGGVSVSLIETFRELADGDQ